MTALKCDRCGSYFDYNNTGNNFIAFGHKHIVISKNFPDYDICPKCMNAFMKWFNSSGKRKSNNQNIINTDNEED